jgi:hypothetical protein
MTDLKRPGVAFWAAVVVVAVPVLYLLSAGPAHWMFARGWPPQWAYDAAEIVYAPIRWIFDYAPTPLRDALRWYLDLWGR